jgi:hypothetical protein
MILLIFTFLAPFSAATLGSWCPSTGHPTVPEADGFASAVDASLCTEAGGADSVLIPKGGGC